MSTSPEITLRGDGPPRRVSLDEGRSMARALAGALADAALLARSRAPAELLADLPASAGEARLTHSGDLMAGAWLASSTATGPQWEYRVSLPAPPAPGLMFLAPMTRADGTWRVESIRFVRLR